MNWQEYKNNVFADGMTYIDEALIYNPNQSWDYLFDEMFVDDGVTGNGSGSYTMNREKAKEYVSDLIWNDDARSAIKEMGMNDFPTDPESADVVARCAALYQVSHELEDYYNERKDDLYDR